MANPADVQSSKACRRLFGKRGIDVRGAEVRVMHGVCHVRGVIAPIPGQGVENLRETVLSVCGFIKRLPGVRDVSLEVIYKGERPG